MAIKNHELDQPIVEAAKEEFLDKGFLNASINSIAKKAGVTTGAIYTRYKGKDDLFCSLVQDLARAIEQERMENQDLYFKYSQVKDFNDIIKVAQKELHDYLDIAFKYQDECRLLLCRSAGSSIENLVNQMLNYKIEKTKEMIAKKTRFEKLDFVDLIMHQQMTAYALIFEREYTKDEARLYLEILGEFAVAGWERIFAKILHEEA